jgi:hydroxypyruvate isomerase
MLRFSAHLGYLFSELPLAERFAAARKAGFAVVEHPGPYAIPAKTLKGILQEQELEFVQMAAPAGDASKGEKGMAALPGREAEFRLTVAEGLDYARAAGAKFLQVQSGLTPAGVDGALVWDTYVRNLRFASDRAADVGLQMLIEPIGAATLEGYFMDRSDLALRALADVGRPNLRILFDVFHSTNAGEDPFRFIDDHLGLIGHLHIADHPGRNQPGTGKIDFASLFRKLDARGFSGAIGCEYKPSGSTLDSLAWFAPFRAKAAAI